MKLKKGSWYVNKNSSDVPGTFVFENEELKCINIIGTEGQPYVIKNPNPDEWAEVMTEGEQINIWENLANFLGLEEKTPGHFYDSREVLYKLTITDKFKGFKRHDDF